MTTAPCSYRWLPRGDETFASMREAIQAARHRILLETYIYADDAVGRSFRDALVGACQRGVEVHVLVDSFGSVTLSKSFWDPLRQAGGHFAWFNPLRALSPRRATFRDHRKLLVCDAAVAFVGGFNMTEDWDGDGVSHGWHDLNLRLEGPTVAVLVDSFEVLFRGADLERRHWIRAGESSHRRRIPTACGEVILSSPGSGPSPIRAALRADLARGRQVRIVAAYFMPPRWLRRSLSRVARRGGRVQLILAGKSDVPLMQLATRSLYRRLLRARIEVHEYQPQILHGKLVVIDDVVYAGSANLDPRSFNINYEFLLRIPDAALAREAVALFQSDLAHCRRIELDDWRKSRTLWRKLLEQLARFVLVRLDLSIARQQLRALRGKGQVPPRR